MPPHNIHGPLRNIMTTKSLSLLFVLFLSQIMLILLLTSRLSHVAVDVAASHVLEPSLLAHSGLRRSESVETINDVSDAVIVGSGLAGLVTALTILDRGSESVVILEKEARVGGNSKLASSGINACCTRQQQRDLTNSDTLELFQQDTYQSHYQPDHHSMQLIDKLVSDSASAVSWLESRLGMDLSQVALLGGHSQPRTHRPAEGMIGATLITALTDELDKYKQENKVKVITNARVKRLLTKRGAVTGVEYEALHTQNNNVVHANAVVLATGGFAANRQLLVEYRPDIAHLPTTAGAFSTGDGILMATAAGAAIVDMDKVQVHPTGWVDPSDPENGSKTLAAELLRGVGGILLDHTGKRFCNELGTRKYISDIMVSRSDRSFFLVLSSLATEAARKHITWYEAKGLTTKVHGVSALADWMGSEAQQAHLKQTLKQYRLDAQKGKDSFNKTVFDNLPSTDLDREEFYVGRVTPVVHYCMGGLAMDENGQVLGKQGRPIPGLYAGGEVTGGLHGRNRLGGNSLLECTVFGRKIGAKVLIDTKNANSGFASNGSPIQFETGQSAQFMENHKGVSRSTRTVSLSELEQHSAADDCWVAIHGRVFDLTVFATKHIGGALMIQRLAGKDGTTLFSTFHKESVLDREDIGEYQIGLLEHVESIDDESPSELEGSVATNVISMATLALHDSADDCWVAIYGRVFDLTDFAQKHIGGSIVIHRLAGTDGTDPFSMFHSPDIIHRQELSGYQIGVLESLEDEDYDL